MDQTVAVAAISALLIMPSWHMPQASWGRGNTLGDALKVCLLRAMRATGRPVNRLANE
jgi:hypothetical protein